MKWEEDETGNKKGEIWWKRRRKGTRLRRREEDAARIQYEAERGRERDGGLEKIKYRI